VYAVDEDWEVDETYDLIRLDTASFAPVTPPDRVHAVPDIELAFTTDRRADHDKKWLDAEEHTRLSWTGERYR
jgi:hypothetical protein